MSDSHKKRPSSLCRLLTLNAMLLAPLPAVAADHAKGRVVSVLEGGYDLGALAESVSTHVQTLMRT